MIRKRTLRQWARRIKHRLVALAIAIRDPRTPWYARVAAAAVVAYAASPIDLIPDFIPVLGYLDDVILLPLGIMLVIRMIPETVMRDALRKAMHRGLDRSTAGGRIAAVGVVTVWLAISLFVALAIIRRVMSAQ